MLRTSLFSRARTRRGRWFSALIAAALFALPSTRAAGQTLPMPAPREFPAQWMETPAAVRAWYRNPDGSCVQCSIGMCGVWNNVPAASTLLWDTAYGPRVRGGSWPSRVSDYARARGIPLYNVTGETTLAWLEWAGRTGTRLIPKRSAVGISADNPCPAAGNPPAIVPGSARMMSPWFASPA